MKKLLFLAMLSVFPFLIFAQQSESEGEDLPSISPLSVPFSESVRDSEMKESSGDTASGIQSESMDSSIENKIQNLQSKDTREIEFEKARLLYEIEALKLKKQRMNQDLSEIKASTETEAQKKVQAAQENSKKIIEQANSRAKEILDDAQKNAAGILEQAQLKAKSIEDEGMAKAQETISRANTESALITENAVKDARQKLSEADAKALEAAEKAQKEIEKAQSDVEKLYTEYDSRVQKDQKMQEESSANAEKLLEKQNRRRSEVGVYASLSKSQLINYDVGSGIIFDVALYDYIFIGVKAGGSLIDFSDGTNTQGKNLINASARLGGNSPFIKDVVRISAYAEGGLLVGNLAVGGGIDLSINTKYLGIMSIDVNYQYHQLLKHVINANVSWKFNLAPLFYK